jgi:hypothetical protein
VCATSAWCEAERSIAGAVAVQAMGEDVWEEFDKRRLIPQVGRVAL